MDEPPIVNHESPAESSNRFADRPANWNAFEQPARPPVKRNKAIWIAAILVVGSALLVCTFMGYALYSFTAKGKTTEAYQKTREKANTSLPRNLVETLNSAEPATESETQEFLPLLNLISQAGEDEIQSVVDLERFSQEIQNSGLGRGVGGLARLLWSAKLEDVLTVPNVYYAPRIVDIEWLAGKQEARLLVVDQLYYTEDSLWLLYVTLKDGEWKLYDWRNLLQPVSETQYFALYSAADPLTQDNYADFANDAWSTFYVEEQSLPERSKEIFAAYSNLTFPPSLHPLAQYTCTEYLLNCGPTPEAKLIVSSMLDESSAVKRIDAAHFFEAKLAGQLGDRPAAFSAAESFLAQVGWHPQAAIMAAMAAQSAEEKAKAKSWLIRSLVLTPSADMATSQFFALANDKDVSALISAYADLQDGQERCRELILNLEYSSESGDALAMLSRAIGKEPKLESLRNRAELSHLVSDGEHEKAIPVFATLLESDVGDLDAFELQGELIARSFHEGFLEAGLSATPDHEEFFFDVRDSYALQWSEAPKDWLQLRDFLKTHRNDSDIAESETADLTQIAIGRCSVELGEYEEAWKILEPIFRRDREFYLDASNPPGSVILVDSLAVASIELGKTKQFKELVPDPAIAFLLLAKRMLATHRSEELSELLAWSTQQDGTNAWSKYYEAQLAIESGNWKSADALLAELAESREADDMYGGTYESESDLLWYAAPIEIDVYTERIDLALRQGKLEDLLTEVLENEREDWALALEYELDDLEDASTIAKAGEILASANSDSMKGAGMRLAAQHSLARRDWESAANYLRRASQSGSSGYYDDDSETLGEILRIALVGRMPNLSSYHDLMSDSEDWQLFQAVEAAIGQDKDLFTGLVASLPRPDWFADDYAKIHALHQSDLWNDYNARFPIDVETLVLNQRESGLTILSVPAQQIQADLLVALQDAFDSVRIHEPTRFPSSSFAFSIDVDEGSLVLIGYAGLPPRMESAGESASLLKNCQGSVFVSFATHGLRPTSKPVRELVARVFENDASAAAFADFRSRCVFRGEGWQTRLQENSSNGFDPENPLDDIAKFLSPPSVECKLVGQRDQKYLRIQYVAEEQILLAEADDSGELKSPLELSEDCVTHPMLKVQTKIKRPSHTWYYNTGY